MFLKAPKNNIRVISHFFKNLERYIFANKDAPPVSTTPAENLSLVSMTPAANFATGTTGNVDTGGTVNCGNNIRLLTP